MASSKSKNNKEKKNKKAVTDDILKNLGYNSE